MNEFRKRVINPGIHKNRWLIWQITLALLFLNFSQSALAQQQGFDLFTTLKSLNHQIEVSNPQQLPRQIQELLTNATLQRFNVNSGTSKEQRISFHLLLLKARIAEVQGDQNLPPSIYQKLGFSLKYAKSDSLMAEDFFLFYFFAAQHSKKHLQFREAIRLYQLSNSYFSKLDQKKFALFQLYILLDYSDFYEKAQTQTAYHDLIFTEVKIQDHLQKYNLLDDLDDQLQRFQRIGKFYALIHSTNRTPQLMNLYSDISKKYVELVFSNKKQHLLQSSIASLIQVYVHLGGFHQLYKILSQMESHHEKLLQDNREIATIFYNQQARLYLDNGLYDQAFVALHKNKKILEESQFPFLVNEALIGHSYFLAGKYEKAESVYQNLLKNILKANISFGSTHFDPLFPYTFSKEYIYYLLSMTSFFQKDHEKTIAYLKEIIETDKKIISDIRIRAKLLMALILLYQGNELESKAYLLQASTEAQKNSLEHLQLISYKIQLLQSLKSGKNAMMQRDLNLNRYYHNHAPQFQYLQWVDKIAEARLFSYNFPTFWKNLIDVFQVYAHDKDTMHWYSVLFFPFPPHFMEKTVTFASHIFEKHKKPVQFVLFSESLKRLQMLPYPVTAQKTQSQESDFAIKLKSEFIAQFHNISFSQIRSSVKVTNLANDTYYYQNTATDLSQQFVTRHRYIQEMKKQNEINTTSSPIAMLLQEKNFSNAFKSMNPDHAVVYFQKVENKLFGVYLSHEQISFFPIKEEYAIILSKINSVLPAIKDSTKTFADKEMQELTKILLTGIQETLQKEKIKNIGFLSSSDLTFFPFASLMLSQEKYLIDEYVIYHIHSLFHFISMQNLQYPLEWNLSAAFAPSNSKIITNQSHTATEVDLIQNLFQNKTILTDDDITKASLTDILLSGKIWHIALPGEIRYQQPEDSFFWLSDEEPQNDKLYFRDIWNTRRAERSMAFFSNVNWPTQATSSVLMRCYLSNLMHQTGFGQYIISLKNSDKNMAIFVSAFYRKLRRQTVLASMHQTQLRLKQRNDHPSNWSSLLLFQNPPLLP